MSAFNQVKMFVVLSVHSFVLLANLSPAFFEGCVDDMREKKIKGALLISVKSDIVTKALQALFFT